MCTRRRLPRFHSRRSPAVEICLDWRGRPLHGILAAPKAFAPAVIRAPRAQVRPRMALGRGLYDRSAIGRGGCRGGATPEGGSCNGNEGERQGGRQAGNLGVHGNLTFVAGAIACGVPPAAAARAASCSAHAVTNSSHGSGRAATAMSSRLKMRSCGVTPGVTRDVTQPPCDALRSLMSTVALAWHAHSSNPDRYCAPLPCRSDRAHRTHNRWKADWRNVWCDPCR